MRCGIEFLLSLKNRRNEMRALCWHGKEDIRCETVPDYKTFRHNKYGCIKVVTRPNE